MSDVALQLDVGYFRTEFMGQPLTRTQTVCGTATCPVCGGGMRPLIAVTGDRRPVLEKDYCEACSFVHFRRVPAPAWFEAYYRTVWDSGRPEPKTLADNPQAYGRNLELIAKYAPDKGAAIFDLGAGYGVFLKQCEAHGYRHLTGAELSPRRLTHCRGIGLEVAESLAERLAESALVKSRGPYDVVHSHHVLEHVYDVRAAIGQVRAILKPGGVAVFLVPNIFSEHFLMISHGLFHVRNFTGESLRRLFETSGFEIVELETGDSVQIVARRNDEPAAPPATPTAPAPALAETFATKFRDKVLAELGLADGAAGDAGVFISRPRRAIETTDRGRFGVFSLPGLLQTVFGAGFYERPIFGAHGGLGGCRPRNVLFKLYRRLLGAGRLELVGRLRRVPVEGGGAPPPVVTISFASPEIQAVIK